ncbi:MAG: hypothetical protein IT203_10535 [Fimbriimonadaceae bacterium]|nr:hypothetical protein [Fimbriimonadaceae bacterium]
MLVFVASLAIGCSSGGSNDTAVNADASKPGQQMPAGLEQSQGASGQGSSGAPAASQTAP